MVQRASISVEEKLISRSQAPDLYGRDGTVAIGSQFPNNVQPTFKLDKRQFTAIELDIVAFILVHGRS
jgi:hypothetical protein